MPSIKAEGLGRHWEGQGDGESSASHFLHNDLLPLCLGLQEDFIIWLLYDPYSLNKRP